VDTPRVVLLDRWESRHDSTVELLRIGQVATNGPRAKVRNEP
jgi:hypothetical protein